MVVLFFCLTKLVTCSFCFTNIDLVTIRDTPALMRLLQDGSIEPNPTRMFVLEAKKHDTIQSGTAQLMAEMATLQTFSYVFSFILCPKLMKVFL